MCKYGAIGLSVFPLRPFFPDPKMPLRQKHSWPFGLKFLRTVSVVICFEVEDRVRCPRVSAVPLRQPLLSKKKSLDRKSCSSGKGLLGGGQIRELACLAAERNI